MSSDNINLKRTDIQYTHIFLIIRPPGYQIKQNIYAIEYSRALVLLSESTQLLTVILRFKNTKKLVTNM